MRSIAILLGISFSGALVAQLSVPVRIVLDGAAPEDRQMLGLADPIGLDAAASVDAVRATSSSRTTVLGTGSLTGSLEPAPTGYSTGMSITIVPISANSPEATLDLNGLGARPIVKWGQVPLDSADLMPGMPARLVYDGTRFLLLNTTYRPCPQGYSPASATSCISDTFVAINTFANAAMVCDSLGARLCKIGEWASACRMLPGFLATVLATEWVDDGANSASDGKLMGTGSSGPATVTDFACEYGFTSSSNANQRFRCCLSR
jgi:hypothetical protein